MVRANFNGDGYLLSIIRVCIYLSVCVSIYLSTRSAEGRSVLAGIYRIGNISILKKKKKRKFLDKTLMSCSCAISPYRKYKLFTMVSLAYSASWDTVFIFLCPIVFHGPVPSWRLYFPWKRAGWCMTEDTVQPLSVADHNSRDNWEPKLSSQLGSLF